MSKTQHITCYLCERKNRLPAKLSGTAALRCGACRALLVDIITCPSCGAQNRVKIRFAEHQQITCGKCHTPLTTYQFERAITKHSASKQVLCNALIIEGKIQQWKGNWETAIQLFQQAQKYSKETSQNQVKLAIGIGLCHAYLGNYKKTAAYLEGVDAIESDEFSMVYELARAYGLLGDLERTITCFEKSRECLVTDTTTRQHVNNVLGSLYTLRDNDTTGLPPLRATILLYDAIRDYDTENLQAGVQKLQRAIEIDPMNPALYHHLGIGFLRQGQFEQAVAMLERGLEFDPSHEQAQFSLGDAYFHLGLYECALNAYKQTLHLNPQNIDAYHHLGLVYEQQGEIEIAKGYWEDVLKVAPNHKEARQSLERHG